MSDGPSTPRESTIRKLFALSSNRCAFPGCQTAIVDGAAGTILGEVCHIHAQKEGGPRFDAGQTAERRHSGENLMLLCGVHHKLVDAKENALRYSAEALLAMKAQHEAGAQATEPRTPLTAEAVAALLETARPSHTTQMDFRGARFTVGGQGGGPGGGGGGGGVLNIVGATPAGFREEVDLKGKPGRFPGGGGGGGGAMVASGRPVSEEDIRQGLRVNAFFFANAVEIANGLLHTLGAGWETLTIAALPQDARVIAVTIIETGTIAPNTLLGLEVVASDPSGAVVNSTPFDLGVSPVARPIMRQCLWKPIVFRVDQLGVWSFAIRSGDTELARTTLELKQKP